MNKDIVDVFEFIKFIDRVKLIDRQNYLADASRHENDAEHSWHLALATILLSDYAAEKIDQAKTVKMVLIHDLVEIYAGDTYCYDNSAKVGQSEREFESAKKLFGQLPEEKAKEMFSLWCEFEEMKTPESRFAKAMDRLQPVLLNIGGNGRSWKEHGIRFEQVYQRNLPLKDVAPMLWEYLEKELRAAFDNL